MKRIGIHRQVVHSVIDQEWIETVSEGKECQVIISDGRVK